VELKQIGIYSSSAEANLVRARLQANGIEAIVQADSGYGTIPQLEAYSGVKVLVRPEDLEEALDVLERLLPSSTD
jgi:hypothetical protein